MPLNASITVIDDTPDAVVCQQRRQAGDHMLDESPVAPPGDGQLCLQPFETSR